MKRKNLRKKIIDAAVRLFAQKGFHETTVDDIAKAAKIAKGTPYLYFKDKSSLYISVIDEHLIGGITFIKKIQQENLTNTEQLKKIAEGWLNYMLKFKNTFPMYSMENINLTKKIMKQIKPIMASRFEEVINLIGEIIEKGIETGEFRKIHPHLGALYFLNVIRTAFFAHIFFPNVKSPESKIGDILMFGFKGR